MTHSATQMKEVRNRRYMLYNSRGIKHLGKGINRVFEFAGRVGDQLHLDTKKSDVIVLNDVNVIVDYLHYY